MGVVIILFLILFSAKIKYKPRIEYIEESKMWIIHYNYKTSRKYKILIRL